MELFKESDKKVIFKVKNDDQDLEKFLLKQNISGRLFRRLYREKQIYVNGVFQRKSLELKSGDIVTLYMLDEKESIFPEPIDLDIIYEDWDLLILNKASNMVVHPTKAHQSNTLSNGVAYYFKRNNINSKIRFVNRLDRNTTGLIIVAKNPLAHHQLSLEFENNRVGKKYLTIVNGKVEEEQEYIDLPIGRIEEGNIKKMVTSLGQPARSSYKVLERYGDVSLLEVQIYTGRSHQIRVHFSHIGHPIIGDELYYMKSPFINRQALHSSYLRINHPRTGEEMEFTAGLPEDMKKLLKLLKNK